MMIWFFFLLYIFFDLQPPQPPLRRSRSRLTNSEITHTGSAIAEGTRFVLMTSITLDDEEDYDNYEDNDDDVNEDDE
jgi:hypothetical protein